MFWVAFANPHKKGSNFVRKLFAKGQFLYFAWAEAVVTDYVGSVSELLCSFCNK